MASDFQQINDYNFNIDSFVQGNNGAVLRFNVRRKGAIVPIDNATVNVAIKRGQELITKNATIISAPSGICEVILTRADLATAGTYYLQPTIIFPDDDEFSGDVQKFTVSGKLTGTPTNPGNGGTNPVFTVRDSAINGNIIINGAETVVYDDAAKVDKVAGKGLSTNDYDNTEKAEVAKVKNKADTTYVDSQLGLKADKTYVDTQLGTTNANVTANSSKIGTLSSLQTTDKTNLVNAVNDNKSKLNDLGVNIKDYGAKGDGVTDDTNAFQSAINDANTKGVPLFLPPGNYLLSKSINNILSVIGAPNKTTITLAPDFTKTSYAGLSQFCFTNPNFSNGGYNPSTADKVFIKHISVTTTPNAIRSIFGFANISALEMYDVTITANKVINQATGRPNAVDALIDLYASVKNAKIHSCKLNNLTYARGATYPWSAGGGGCIWVRNIVGSAALGAIDLNATEHIDIFNNTLTHATSDETLAVYGVVGKTRKVNIRNNRIYGLDVDPNQIVFYNTLISAFPFKHATLGANASVEDVLITDNYISSRSHFYSVMRFGSSSDTNVICQRIKSSRNTIVSFVSSDATSGPQAVWVANGSPAGEPPPNLNVLVLRAVQGSSSTFSNSNASLESDNDTLVCSGNANWGITGFDNVSNPVIKGSAFYGAAYCINVTGGNIEASSVSFYNCNNVSDVRVKTNLTGGYVAQIDSTSGLYTLKGIYGSSTGGLCRTTSATTSSTIVNVFSNSLAMSDGSTFAISNGGTALVTSRLNTVIGTLAGGTNGTVTTSLNRWGATTD